jgi:Homeodomain-like domain-containing protein
MSLSTILHGVRQAQQGAAIFAEVLILLAFAMSGLDASLGGSLVQLTLVKWVWGVSFALGVDAAFVISWVRVSVLARQKRWLAFIGSLFLAVALGAVVFQQVGIQLYQQTMGVAFSVAVRSLGFNLVELTLARTFVAVFLGAVLALTNVEPLQSDARALHGVPGVASSVPGVASNVAEIAPIDARIDALLLSDANMSQRAIAEHLGVAPSTVSRAMKSRMNGHDAIPVA